MTRESVPSSNTVFIVSDTYQVMQAIEWAISNNIKVSMFNTNTALQLFNSKYVDVYNIQPMDLYRTVDNVLNTHLNPEQHEFFRCMYDPDTELHVFDNVDILFQKGLTDIHLHEAGESSYELSTRTGFYGEDDPFTVAEYHIQDDIDDTSERCKRMKKRNVFRKMSRVLKKEARLILGYVQPADPPENTILFIHNEPDDIRYNSMERYKIYDSIRRLLIHLKYKGYTIWFKDHHKRPGRLYVEDIVDAMVECPVELLNTQKFRHVVSVRSRCVDYLQGNCYNGLTREDIQNNTHGFADIYLRGLDNIKEHL